MIPSRDNELNRHLGWKLFAKKSNKSRVLGKVGCSGVSDSSLYGGRDMIR